LDDADHLAIVGRNGRATFDRLYTPQSNLAQLESIYADAIKSSRGVNATA
jgi:hypothetical protein